MGANTPDPAAGPESRWADLDGPVHYVDHGGPSDAPVLVCVHGLGGSLVNWAALAPLLTLRCRVLALDLAGFGHTVGGSRSTSVQANQRLLDRFLVEVVGTPAVLVGNSMGGLISVLQAARCPITVTGLVLIDPALPVGLRNRPDPWVAATFAALAVPAIGRTLLARHRSVTSAEVAATDLLRLCCYDATRVPRHVVDQHVELAALRRAYPDVDAELLTAARSLVWVLADRRRYGAMQRAIDVPVLLLHGDRDRLVPVSCARSAARANPSWRLEIAHDVGHVPQLEAPGWTAERILEFLADHPECAPAGKASGRRR
ncbi:MAG TPA: alpha/beta hydrolase [Actinomycetes bacterium]|nr:alpha/beta hydrolase [Actinomycetes bacterium]